MRRILSSTKWWPENPDMSIGSAINIIGSTISRSIYKQGIDFRKGFQSICYYDELRSDWIEFSDSELNSFIFEMSDILGFKSQICEKQATVIKYKVRRRLKKIDYEIRIN